jgi:paraquat-inducible protein B
MAAANKSLVGGFVLGALGLLIAAIIVFGSGKFFEKRYYFDLYFEGSVGGLNVGAPVVFKGVKIGSVTKIVIQGDVKADVFRIPVIIEIDPQSIELVNVEPGRNFVMDPYTRMKILIEQGLRGQLQTQSFLTGQLMVSLDFFPDKPAIYRGSGKMPEIPTVPTTMEEVTKTLRNLPLKELVNSLLSTVEGIDRLVRSSELKETLISLKNTSDKTAEAVAEYRNLARQLTGKVDGLGKMGEETLRDYDQLAKDARTGINSLISGIKPTLETTGTAMDNAGKTFSNTRELTSPSSNTMRAVVKTLEEMSLAARSVRVLADYIAQHPEALIRGKSGTTGR